MRPSAPSTSTRVRPARLGGHTAQLADVLTISISFLPSQVPRVRLPVVPHDLGSHMHTSRRPTLAARATCAVLALLPADVLSTAASLPATVPAPASAQQVGPENGSLIVAGGALRDPAVFQRFVELAGGPSAPVVVIPTAGGADAYDQFFQGRRPFENAGARHVTVLHTYDPQVADTDAFAEPLRQARGVWFTGGRQWRLADSYLNTKVHDALWDVLARGGVIGGSSAGASIQGSYLVRGDTRTNTVMMGDHEVGLGFLKGVAIDQHLLRRNRHFDLIEVIRAKPELLGIGLDENTAIVVRGDRFEVVGQSYAVIYDHRATLDTGGLFYFLAPGDRYDMAARQAFRPSRGQEELERVTGTPWPPPESSDDAS